MNVKKLTTLAMLTAISMIVFLIEAQIPLPFAVPGIKLGIANVITLFVLWMYGWKEAGAFVPSGGSAPFQLALSLQFPPADTLVHTAAFASVGAIVTFTTRQPEYVPLATSSFT